MKKKLYFLFLLTLAIFLAGCRNREVIDGYHIEYISSANDEIVKVPYEPESTETMDLIKEFLTVLCTDSENVDYRKPIPNNVEITMYSLEGAMLTIWFDTDYYNMNAVENVLCTAAVVRTMTQIEGVDGVTFYVGDEQLKDAKGNLVGTLTADNFVENPGQQINSIQDAALTLYFANAAGDGLVAETRNVHYSSNISIEKLIMEQLLEGPETAGLKSAIPAGTKIVSVTLVDGICYVNLDSNFKNQDYTVLEPIVIYSIVNSLSEVSTISQVQISVNGDTSGVYRDTYNLSEMYTRNLDYVTTLEAGDTEAAEGTESLEATENTEAAEPAGDTGMTESIESTETENDENTVKTAGKAGR